MLLHTREHLNYLLSFGNVRRSGDRGRRWRYDPICTFKLSNAIYWVVFFVYGHRVRKMSCAPSVVRKSSYATTTRRRGSGSGARPTCCGCAPAQHSAAKRASTPLQLHISMSQQRGRIRVERPATLAVAQRTRRWKRKDLLCDPGIQLPFTASPTSLYMPRDVCTWPTTRNAKPQSVISFIVTLPWITNQRSM